MEGGEFTPGDRYGRITSKTFCLLGVVHRNSSQDSATPGAATVAHSDVYLAHLLYYQSTVTTWVVVFLATKDIRAIAKVLYTLYNIGK